MTNESTSDKAAEVRKGLVGSIAGKAKEVVGAVTRNDDLVEGGQLEQAEAHKRKVALAEDAVAEAKLTETAQDLRETIRETGEQRHTARARADREQSLAEQQRASEHAAATRDAERLEALGRENAEHEAEQLAESRLGEAEALAADAVAIEQQSAADKARLEREAVTAEQQAERLRTQTTERGTS